MKKLVKIINIFISKKLIGLRFLNQVFYGLLFLMGGALIIAWIFLGLISLGEFIFRLIKIDLLLFCLSEAILLVFFLILKYWEIKKNFRLIKRINRLAIADNWNKKLFNSQNALTIHQHPKQAQARRVYIHPLDDEEAAAFNKRRLHLEIFRKIMGLGECFLIAKMILIIENGGNFFTLLSCLGGTLLLTIIKGNLISSKTKKDF